MILPLKWRGDEGVLTLSAGGAQAMRLPVAVLWSACGATSITISCGRASGTDLFVNSTRDSVLRSGGATSIVAGETMGVTSASTMQLWTETSTLRLVSSSDDVALRAQTNMTT